MHTNAASSANVLFQPAGDDIDSDAADAHDDKNRKIHTSARADNIVSDAMKKG